MESAEAKLKPSEEKFREHVEEQIAKIERYFQTLGFLQNQHRTSLIQKVKEQALQVRSEDNYQLSDLPLFHPSRFSLELATKCYGIIGKVNQCDEELTLELITEHEHIQPGTHVDLRVVSGLSVGFFTLSDFTIIVKKATDESPIKFEIQEGTERREILQLRFNCQDFEPIYISISIFGKEIEGSPLEVQATDSGIKQAADADIKPGLLAGQETDSEDIFSDSEDEKDTETTTVATVKELSPIKSLDAEMREELSVSMAQADNAVVATEGKPEKEEEGGVKLPSAESELLPGDEDDDKTTSPPRSSSSSTLRSSYASAGKGDKTYEVQLPPPGSYSPLMSSFDEYTDEDEDDDALQQWREKETKDVAHETSSSVVTSASSLEEVGTEKRPIFHQVPLHMRSAGYKVVDRKMLRRPLGTITNASKRPVQAEQQKIKTEVTIQEICNQMEKSASSSPQLNTKGSLNFLNLVRNGKVELKSSLAITIRQCSKSIGGCILRSGNLILCDTIDKPFQVRLFSPQGRLIRKIISQVEFRRPAATVELSSGLIAIIDDFSIHILDEEEREAPRRVLLPENAKHYGLVEDSRGRLVTAEETKSGRGRGYKSLICMNPATGRVEDRIIIPTTSQESKIRFLSYKQGLFYITDLGLDKLYIISESGEIRAEVGRTGRGLAEFDDPAGTAVDDQGNFIVADSKNHKLVLYSRGREVVCKVDLDPPTRRPSDICLSSDGKSLLVLNLHSAKPAVIYPLLSQ